MILISTSSHLIATLPIPFKEVFLKDKRLKFDESVIDEITKIGMDTLLQSKEKKKKQLPLATTYFPSSWPYCLQPPSTTQLLSLKSEY